MGVFSDVKPGDIILFSDIYWITSHLTRLGTVSRWTHVSMVIDISIDGSDILMWEVSHNVFPLRDRLTGKLKSAGTRLVWFRERLRTFPKRGNRTVIMRLNHNGLYKNSQILELYQRIMSLLWLMREVKFRSSYYLFLRAAFSHNMRTIRDSKYKTIYKNQYKKPSLFCSEALAIIYQELGIVWNGINPKRVVPADFAYRTVNGNGNIIPPLLPFINGWRLEPFMSLNMRAF